jgi:hypothetical protein
MRPISYRIGYQDETKNINSVEFHPELSNDRHPVDGALVGADGALWPLHLPLKTTITQGSIQNSKSCDP